MRWAGAVLLFLMVPSHGAVAACDLEKRYDSSFRDTVLDLAIDGATLWAATSWGVIRYDRSSDPPRAIGAIQIPGRTKEIAAENGVAWVGSGEELYTVLVDDGRLRVVDRDDTESTILDLLVDDDYLWVGTADGIVQYDLFVPTDPFRGKELETGTGRAFSLARKGSFLYAADGDSTVNVYSVQVPTLPQQIGTFDSIQGALAVHVDGDRIVVSNGRGTEVHTGSGTAVFSSGTLAGFGTASYYSPLAQVAFVAGTDTTLRVVDFSVLTFPNVLFERQLIPVGGSSNQIEAIVGDQDRVYVGAGDQGLVSWNISGFRSPFPVRTHGVGSVGSLVSTGDHVYAAMKGGGIFELDQASTGQLTIGRTWDAGTVSRVWNGGDAGLFASEGASLSLWTLTSGAPAKVGTVTLSGAPISVATEGATAWAVLGDRSIVRVDFSRSPALLDSIVVEGIEPTFVDAAGGALALTSLKDDGTTSVYHFANSFDLTSPSVVTFNGSATLGIGLAPDGRAAAVTFAGLHLLDLGAGTATLLPGTDSISATAVELLGDRVVVLSSGEILIWRFSTRAFEDRLGVSGAPATLAVAESWPGLVATGGLEGVTTFFLDSGTNLPLRIADTNSNRYYRKVVSAPGRIALYDGTGIDALEIRSFGLSSVPRKFPLEGSPVDVAAIEAAVCALEGDARVACYDWGGRLLSRIVADESADVIPFAIHSVGDSLWVSLSRGCLSGSCENVTVTLDLDEVGLAVTSSLPGRTVDVISEGGTAWAITELPDSLLALDVSFPSHPVAIGQAATLGDPVSIAFDSGTKTIYTLGATMVAWSTELNREGELLDPWEPDPLGLRSYVDQRLAISDGCAVIAGRDLGTQFFAIAGALDWTLVDDEKPSSSAKSMTSEDGFVFILGSHSIRVWTGEERAKRKRPVR